MSHFNFKTIAPLAAFLVCTLFVTAAPTIAHADTDDEDVPGEIVLKTKFEFVKFSVNGKAEWENHEYTNGRKTLVILGLSRADDNTIVLTPRVAGYEPVTLVVKPSDFKRQRVKKNGRRVAIYRFTKKVRFGKVSAAAPAPKAKAKAKPKAAPKTKTK